VGGLEIKMIEAFVNHIRTGWMSTRLRNLKIAEISLERLIDESLLRELDKVVLSIMRSE